MAHQSHYLSDVLDSCDPSLQKIEITGLTMDSRKVVTGGAFIAVPGSVRDGAQFVEAAVMAGARVILGEEERPVSLPVHVAYQRVPDSRRTVALMAARFYSAQPEAIVAITGTSGKSSVVDFYRQMMSALGEEAASLGTIGVTTSKGVSYGGLTTPDPISLHQTLETLTKDGITYLAMEASSHGIEQRRLDGVRLKAAAFTNIGRDHLDYHKTVDAYIEAKLRLFETLLPNNGYAVINTDGAYAERFLKAAQKRSVPIISTGRKGKTLQLEQVVVNGFSQELTLGNNGRMYSVTLPLPGDFQSENVLVAAGLVLASNQKYSVADVLALFPTLKGVKGRMEKVGEVNGALCIVDYAHKPDALSHVLDSLRLFTSGRLICVFGCGGDRDKGKRPIMGQVAAEKADIAILTDDNPRTEDPSAIRAGVLAGISSSTQGVEEISGRSDAIFSAVRRLQPGDILVVAGKGHETGQIIGNETLHFSDEEEILKAIAEVTR